MTVPSVTQLRNQNLALTQELDRATTKIRYLKVALAIMTGIIASLIAYLVANGLGASPLTAIGSGASALIVVTGFVFTVQEQIKRP